jgi:hypothetical protein
MISRLLRMMLLTGLLLAAKSACAASNCPGTGPAAGFTTCRYVDYSTGSDSNDGLGEASGHPWKHMPGMVGTGPDGSSHDGCTGNCSSFTPSAGTAIILRGGVVWPATSQPINWGWSGKSTTSAGFGCTGTGCIYIGIDPAWNTGQVNAVITTRDFGGCPSSGVTATIAAPTSGGTTATARANMMGGLSSFADGSTYDVAYWTVTNPGSGYTSNPSVSAGAAGCRNLRAVADIYRAVIDAGAPGSDWTGPLGTNGTLNVFTGSYIILDNIEFRNARYSPASQGEYFSHVGVTGNWSTASNLFVHNFYPDTSPNFPSAGEGGSNIAVYSDSSDLANSYISEGDASFTCPSYPDICAWGGFGNVNANHVHGNRISFFIWAVKSTGGVNSGGVIDVFGNEVWGAIASSGSNHLNLFYIGSDGATMNIYNNVFYDNVGATNQMPAGISAGPTTFNVYNNVGWNTGSGGSIFQPDLGENGAHSVTTTYNFFNNTLGATGVNGYGSAFTGSVITTGSCNASTQCAHVNINLFNNTAISSQSNAHWFQMNNPVNTVNGAGGPSNTTADSVNTALSLSAASTSGSTVGNMFQPATNGSPVMSLALSGNGKNFTGANPGCGSPGLAALCSDILGIARPSTGPWPAGAFVYTGKVIAPASLVAVPH